MSDEDRDRQRRWSRRSRCVAAASAGSRPGDRRQDRAEARRRHVRGVRRHEHVGGRHRRGERRGQGGRVPDLGRRRSATAPKGSIEHRGGLVFSQNTAGGEILKFSKFTVRISAAGKAKLFAKVAITPRSGSSTSTSTRRDDRRRRRVTI